ncbi:MAG: hypothetical protein ACYC2P_10455 [Paludibacteraceae bacterium]
MRFQMLVQLSNIIILFIPLVLLPILLSIALFRDSFDTAFHWWSGILLISLTAIIFHALNINPAVYCVIITVSILALSIWQKQAIKQHILRAKELIQHIDYVVVIMVVIVLVFSGILVVLTQPIPQGGDTFSIWLNKTKSIYSGIPHPALPVAQYPSLGPTFQAFAMRFTGGYEPVYGLFFGPIAYCFWVLSLFGVIKQRSGWIMVAILRSISMLFFDDYVVDGYQDKLLTMCASMSVLSYLQLFSEYSLPSNQEGSRMLQLLFWLGTFFAAMLSLIKSEGTIMGLILVGASLLAIYLTRPKQLSTFLKKNYPSIITFIVIVLLWPLILYTGNVNLSNIQGDNLTLESLFDIPRNIERIFFIWPYFINYFRKTSLMLFFSVFLTTFAFFKSPQQRISLAYLWLIWLVHSLFIVLAFLSTRAPLIWHLDTAFNRLTSQHAFIYPLIILLVIAFLLGTTNHKVTLVDSVSIANL